MYSATVFAGKGLVRKNKNPVSVFQKGLLEATIFL